MIMFDKKHAMTTIMGKRSLGGEQESSAPMAPEVVKDEDGEIDGRHVAAQDAISAFHEKSADKLMQALANFHDLHMLHREKDSGEME